MDIDIYKLGEKFNLTESDFVHDVGLSAPISRYICDKLMILGYFSMMSEYMESVEKNYEEKPLLIVVSKSGETASILNLCQKAMLKNVPVIVLTGMKNSSMENCSEITFVIKNSNPLDDRGLEKNDFFGNTILFFEELIEQYLK
ncbi:SIS domain-containing protein [Candidatus Cetobacterium colombiensis]|uniref:SIS domain-containing protein n=1 Tax=Candidatus Cetobacterium colombiensis TaxID=3073100 RepID=A0ABU4WBX1_9FUSO|nr:SIS domain-containing protein [Candidatus Cetobacterium colombiensis]MDX8337047.1 SIS domain-containing protein [Candidatus Cetobacterium colombiensis]